MIPHPSPGENATGKGMGDVEAQEINKRGSGLAGYLVMITNEGREGNSRS